MDIKSWGVGLGIATTLAGILMAVGSVMNRLEVIEQKSFPDIKPLVQKISVNEGEIKVLNAIVNEMKAKRDNPLSQ
tara:strand:+ start:702 stop:929 length:228 start_codon:yes stop_codon:yes gene_type:complete